ncbi:P-loop containing nucleoside triphosphate hydrolase protein [Annulohypoxylon maeteangense]|uniref:P-loop containing nucleoside triphosphate hydrolase protein n=1 Tax=Annulohypoxylon maeteangense TaxID=1927788 RepID=UPI002007D32C|nr:P-loop containing nucleoside triphosphate hydrolase protein [Annulohypoxylon maeteangense]KAI0884557.1 P-loop containing nucleoside triphosphate hydrolase protein [Annulohypoxylon maeteangense]
MYARYVPPPKGAAKSPEPQHAVETIPTPPTNSQPTAYARYIPPIKPTNGSNHPPPSHHVHFDENDNNNEPPTKKARLTEEEEVSREPKKKSKKSKKSKKEVESNLEDLDGLSNDVVTQDALENGDVPVEHDVPEQEVDREAAAKNSDELISKVKKEKKSKKARRKSESGAQDEVEDETPVRYRSVLEKAAKSMQAPEPRTTAEGEGDAEMKDASNGDDGTDAKPEDAMDLDEEASEVHGLQPLPQPKPIILDAAKPAYETLPPWLAKPIRVSPNSTAPFTQFGLSPDLGIAPEVAEKLATNGYKQAFAIQTAVIPLLLPHHDKTMHGDVLVSAATGSGKTLAYTLPIIRDLSQGNRHLTRLRAVIVLPTRELVRQVQQVCEQCAGIFSLDGSKRRVRVGIAMGSQSLDKEQATLVEREEKYDPEAYAKRRKRLASESGYGSAEDSDEGYNTEDEERSAIRKREDKIPTLPDHVISYTSKVDILICTPGRLVEHIKGTPGFSLDFVRWLVVDEADKLLGQNFQQWLDVVMPRLQSNNMHTRNHKQFNLSGVRKIVLSATMTRDLDRLEGLKLRWPKLIMLEGSGIANEPEPTLSKAELALPELLEEAALKVSDPNLKPLFLLDLLQSDHILRQLSPKNRPDLSNDETSSSGSDSESDSELETFRTSRATSARGDLPSVLIFTKSNETALRLSRLLSLLSPVLGKLTGTLTSTTQYATRRRTIQSFLAKKLRILVASDLVARGIDLPFLDHVINYDIPSSVASYVHRVGRTARAGKTGKAWTLLTNREARWFWNEIASETAIQRNGQVERIRITEEKEDAFEEKVAAYESALAKLGDEASESKNRARQP